MKKMFNYTLDDITLNLIDGKHGGCDSTPGTGKYFISVKDLKSYKIEYKDAKEISVKDYEECNRRTKLELGDTIYANSGDTIGKSLFINDESYIGKTTFQKSVAILKPNQDIVDSRYFYYLMKYSTPRLRRVSTGSGQKNLLLDTMKRFKVLIHERSDQELISSFFGKFDDCLSNLYQENEKIYQMIDLYYKYLISNESCKKLNLEKVSDITTGKKDANFASKDGKYKFFTCASDASLCDEYCFDGKNILVAGNGSFNVKHYDGKFNAYQRTYVIKPHNDLHYGIIYTAVLNNIEKFTKGSNGSIVKFIRLSDINDIDIYIPDEKYCKIINNLLELIDNNNKEIDYLEKSINLYLHLAMNNKILLNN